MGEVRRDAVVRVDASTGAVETERVPERWRQRYVGGKALGARYLYDAVGPDVDPLDPGNLLAFVVGPLTGYAPGEQRYAAVTKSPLTGAFLDSYAGGTFPSRLAGALRGGLGVLVTGRAPEVSVLVVEDGDARLEAAPELAGATIDETCAAYPDAAVACVGPAGENEVLYATVGSDGGDHHAGRGGAGAVMGSKNLKAVVARGDPPDPPAAVAAVRERYEERYADADEGRWLAASATLETVDFANEVGVLPTRGWQQSTFEGADDIGIEAARDAATARERADDAVPGGFRVPGDDGETVPRGSTPISLGAGLGIDDFDAVAALGGRCDSLGVDVIAAGNAVAWTVRAADAGVVDRDLSFGDGDGARALIEEVAGRETPLGDALADGVDAAADRFGGADLIPTVKAMALPSYDPRGSPAMALAYATSDRGACHRRARPVEREAFAPGEWTDEERAAAVAREQDRRSALWSLVVDDFAGGALDDLGAAFLAALDHPAAAADLAAVGERAWTLARLFNVREGFARADDCLPEALTTPLPDGPNAGRGLDPDRFERLLDAYYDRRGWGRDGRPAAATVDRLGLTDLADPALVADETEETP